MVTVGAVEMWEKRSVFCGAFSKHMVEIIRKKSAEGSPCRFPQVRHFHGAWRPVIFSRGVLRKLRTRRLRYE
jgi:hypothetical protein